jgi:hypothetical protein
MKRSRLTWLSDNNPESKHAQVFQTFIQRSFLYVLFSMFTVCGFGQNNALNFDGNGDYVSFSTKPPFSNNMTLEAWIKIVLPSGYSIPEPNIMCWSDWNTTAEFRLEFTGTFAKLQFGIDASGWNSITGSTNINTGDWVHVALIKNGTTSSLYINGVLETSGTVNGTPANSVFQIGNLKEFGVQQNRYFPGLIDEVRIWSVVKTAQNIIDGMYDALAGDETNLVAYYKMSDGSGTTLTDNKSSGTMYNGTIVNATWTNPGAPSDLTWTGASGTDWSTSTNWNAGYAPNTSTRLNIPTGVSNYPVISSGTGASCGPLTVAPAASLTVESGGSLITYGTITNNGTINVKRSITNGSWHLVSAPTSGATANSFVAGDYLQSWDEATATWTDIADMNTPLTVAKGYGLWNSSGSARTYTFTGTPYTGSQSISISANGTGGSYNGANLLGNPYTSSLDWSYLDNTYGAVYYWNGSAYVSWNNDVGGGVRYIPPMQGFFVVTGSNTTFSSDNLDRTNLGATNFYKSANEIDNGLVLFASNGNYYDELYIILNENAHDDFEQNLDAYKIPSGTSGLSEIYSVGGGKNLSIDVRPNCDFIPLGFGNDTSGIYQIGLSQINGINKLIILEDTKTGIHHDLKSGVYTFNWDSANDDVNRFKLLFNAVGVEEIEKTGFSVYTNGQTIHINNNNSALNPDMKVLDMTGRIVLSQRIGSDSQVNIPTQLNSGLYLVCLIDGNRVVTQKVRVP